MTDMKKIIKGLNDIGAFITGRIGFKQARNFLRTIDEAIALLKEQEAVEGHRIVHEYCAKDTKDVVDEVIENLCHLSDDEQGVCCCAIKYQEHTKKTINPTQTNAKNNALDVR